MQKRKSYYAAYGERGLDFGVASAAVSVTLVATFSVALVAIVSVTLVATVELLPVSEWVGPGDEELLLLVVEALGEGDEGGFKFS